MLFVQTKEKKALGLALREGYSINHYSPTFIVYDVGSCHRCITTNLGNTFSLYNTNEIYVPNIADYFRQGSIS